MSAQIKKVSRFRFSNFKFLAENYFFTQGEYANNFFVLNFIRIIESIFLHAARDKEMDNSTIRYYSDGSLNMYRVSIVS